MLRQKYIPVAIDQWYTRRQQDEEGKFYQSIAKQGPRKDMRATTQGLYVVGADGKLIGYNNNRHPGPIRNILKKALETYRPTGTSLKASQADPEYDRSLPDGATVVQVNAKVLGGYPETEDRYQKIFQAAISRDNLWILKDELKQLAAGKFPDSLATRIARFHLIDNTRGEPFMWTKRDIKKLEVKLQPDGELVGKANLESSRSTFDVTFRGKIRFAGTTLKQFDLVARGQYSGHGPYTRNPPPGKFPFAVAFRLASESDPAIEVAPQGSKGWLADYLNTP